MHLIRNYESPILHQITQSNVNNLRGWHTLFTRQSVKATGTKIPSLIDSVWGRKVGNSEGRDGMTIICRQGVIEIFPNKVG